MADRWLKKLELVDNMPTDNRNKRKLYNVDYEKYMKRSNSEADSG